MVGWKNLAFLPYHIRPHGQMMAFGNVGMPYVPHPIFLIYLIILYPPCRVVLHEIEKQKMCVDGEMHSIQSTRYTSC